MKQLSFLSLILIVLFGACTTKEKPNVILVITDDQGYGDLACHGNPVLKTPNLDKLHSESVRFTDFHVTSTCAPTRGALMTGHNTNRAGSWHTIASREMVFADEVMLPEVLQHNGYSTAIFGKWHLGDNHPFRPQDRGFEETFVHLAGGVGQSPDYWLNDYFDDTYFRNGKPEKVKGYCTDVWFENAMEYIGRKADEKQPFFCYLSTNAPHGPHFVPDKYREMYEGKDGVISAAYNGMITNIDDNMGQLMQLLENKNIADNTILIFMTDNGAGNGSGFKLDKEGHVREGYNAGMRGSKVSMYEGGHRVPFFVRWPAKGVNGGVDVDELTAHVDFFPTMIEALGLSGTEELKFDGVSLLDLMTGTSKKLKPRVVVTDTQREINLKKWKMCSTMKDKWRLINGKALYNVKEDPGQKNDVSASHPELVKELRQAYEEWWTSLEPVMDKWQHFTLCHATEPITVLCAHDLITDNGDHGKPKRTLWEQKHVREKVEEYMSTGYYNVYAEEDATFRFTLYRYPPEAELALNASAPEAGETQDSNVIPYKKGIPIPIEKAFLNLDGDEMVANVDPEKPGYSFDLTVKKGEHKLRADFAKPSGERFGAIYIKVEKLN